MTSLEKKLAEYRDKRTISTHSNYNRNILHFFSKKDEDSKEQLIGDLDCDLKDEKCIEPIVEDTVDDNINCCSYMDIVYYTLCLMLWATLWAVFIKLQFGTVYLILSVLIGIYLNTRTRPKYKGEISAYSVFNKNCESIDGTLKAEQFEREIRYGPVSVH